MQKQTTTEKFKYGLLKIVDVSGFKILDPWIRLAFGEEPKKQVSEIGWYMVLPILFVAVCLMSWHVIAPRHKTKSGEVPTPGRIWDSFAMNNRLHERENEKQADFALSGENREQRVAEIEASILEQEAVVETMKSRLEEVRTSVQDEAVANAAPYEERYETLKSENDAQQQARKERSLVLAEQVKTGEASRDELLALLLEDGEKKDKEKEAEKLLKDQLADARSNDPKALKEARLAYDASEVELQHTRKRLELLTSSNRSVKVAEAETKLAAAKTKFENADTPAAILSAAKGVARAKVKIGRMEDQEFARAPTIWYYVWRSLFTVFIGFLLAAAIAIPVGIMCGLSRVVMACLTPLISIFKPVSPVVWLLIFQIVVGAFFLNPESHPLFLFFNSLPIIGSLGVNPALIFSACTVAMCAVWPALVNTALGVSSVENDHLNVAKVLKLGLWSRLTKIIIPASLPLMFAGLRISLGVGWMVLIAAEALAASDGLGKFVWDEYQNGSSHSFANIILACFVVGIIGFFLDRMMIVLQRSVSFDDGAATV